jgi:MFS family permease
MGGTLAGGALSLIGWGKFVDRRGPLRGLIVAALLLVPSYLLVVSIPGYRRSAWAAMALGLLSFVGIGIGWSGLQLATTAYKFGIVPEHVSASYMGLHYAALSVGAIGGSMLGGGLSEGLSGWTARVAGPNLDSYQVIIGGCGLLLVPALAMIQLLRHYQV